MQLWLGQRLTEPACCSCGSSLTNMRRVSGCWVCGHSLPALLWDRQRCRAPSFSPNGGPTTTNAAAEGLFLIASLSLAMMGSGQKTSGPPLSARATAHLPCISAQAQQLARPWRSCLQQWPHRTFAEEALRCGGNGRRHHFGSSSAGVPRTVAQAKGKGKKHKDDSEEQGQDGLAWLACRDWDSERHFHGRHTVFGMQEACQEGQPSCRWPGDAQCCSRHAESSQPVPDSGTWPAAILYRSSCISVPWSNA